MANELAIRLVLAGFGAALALGGVWALKSYWALWRRGVETRATVVRAITPYQGEVRFEDQAGEPHVKEKCVPPRYARFVEGETRWITYLPEAPERWEWHKRQHQVSDVIGGVVLMAIGLFLVVMGAALPLR